MNFRLQAFQSRTIKLNITYFKMIDSRSNGIRSIAERRGRGSTKRKTSQQPW